LQLIDLASKLANPRPGHIIFLMNNPLRSIAVVFLGMFFLALRAQALPALEGTVNDANGRPLPGAEIRVETPDSGSVLKVARTDGSGHYLSGTMAADTYRVSLVVNGAVKASIKNVGVLPVDPTQLNFQLKQGGATPQAQGKHFVWVPSATGSNIAGRWVEVDEKGKANAGAGEKTDQRSGGALIKRIQDNSGSAHPNGM
jgi:Carboxypeptidase regulatory-like domain